MVKLSLAAMIIFAVMATSAGCEQDSDCPNNMCCAESDECGYGPKFCYHPSSNINIKGSSDANNFTNATLRSYKAEEKHWDLKAADVYCSTWDAGKPLAWRKKYGWAAFCATNGPKDQEACGTCLKVINIATGSHNVVRIVDKCNNKKGLNLDTKVFQKLDTNRHGQLLNSLTLKYEIVDCKD